MFQDMLESLTPTNKDDTSVYNDEESDGSEDGIQNYRLFFIENKIDKITKMDKTTSTIRDQINTVLESKVIQVSCNSGDGIADLEIELGKAALSLVTDPDNHSENSSESAVITRDRHRNHVKRCIYHLDQFIGGNLPMDAAAEELRLAMQELGRITGRVDVEELLDIIFRDFCIGK
jgi:tRNA modification GTPase